MTLIKFIRLVLDNLKLLIGAPVLVVTLVFFLFSESEKSYTTGAKIYTGFASGYSIADDGSGDYFGIKTKFDNLFQNVRSRNTKKDISLRVMAFYLSMDTISSRDMSYKNQEKFNKFFTQELKETIGISNDTEANFNALKSYANGEIGNEISNILEATPCRNLSIVESFFN